MKIAIMGVGGVGGYFGGKLARYYINNKNVDITFIARGKHLKEIQNNGLKVITEQGTFIAKPDRAIDNPASCGMFDIIIFCVKSYDLEESAKLLRNCVNEQTVVYSFLLRTIYGYPQTTRLSHGCGPTCEQRLVAHEFRQLHILRPPLG